MTLSNEPNNSDQLTFLSPDRRASHSASPESVSDWMTRVATSPLSPLEFASSYVPAGSSSKMSPVSLRAEGGTTSLLSSTRWKSAGIRARGESLTLNMQEWHSDAVACLLSDTLEKTGDHLQRYCLSPRACAGILRRADKRGKKLPELLDQALRQTADGLPKPLAR